MAWNYFVHHYDTEEDRDKEKYVEGKAALHAAPERHIQTPSYRSLLSGMATG